MHQWSEAPLRISTITRSRNRPARQPATGRSVAQRMIVPSHGQRTRDSHGTELESESSDR
jgi:hypothetical protein